MRTKEVTAYIREHADLFWFIPDDRKEQISDECLVETILNYGSMDSVIRLINLLGVGVVARIFSDAMSGSERRKNNYHELTRNYFEHVFRRYAPQYFNR